MIIWSDSSAGFFPNVTLDSGQCCANCKKVYRNTGSAIYIDDSLPNGPRVQCMIRLNTQICLVRVAAFLLSECIITETFKTMVIKLR